MLKQRLLTAIVGLPALLYFLVCAHSEYVFVFFMMCAALSVYEAASMLLPALESRVLGSGGDGVNKIWVFFCVGIGFWLFLVSTLEFPGAERGGIVTAIALTLVVGTFSAKTIDRSLVNMSGFVLSICYGSLPWLSVWDLYLLFPKAGYLMLVLAIVMGGDSGAYFAGKKFGKTPLAPKLSPKKTWEGFFGGMIASIGLALIMDFLYGGELGPWWLLSIAAACGGAAGVLGDLVESAFKRFSEVKDSGKVFPGHGGFLDRADSLLFAAPVVWFVVYCYLGISAT